MEYDSNLFFYLWLIESLYENYISLRNHMLGEMGVNNGDFFLSVRYGRGVDGFLMWLYVGWEYFNNRSYHDFLYNKNSSMSKENIF